MEDSIRVLIADDHPLFRDGMRGLLGSLAEMEVVGEASSGEQAMELARELQPDVILMDIKMPGINGIEATREIVHTSPRIGVSERSLTNACRTQRDHQTAGRTGLRVHFYSRERSNVGAGLPQAPEDFTGTIACGLDH